MLSSSEARRGARRFRQLRRMGSAAAEGALACSAPQPPRAGRGQPGSGTGQEPDPGEGERGSG